MFTFLNPIFLVGILSAAIPLLIHLSRSRRTKKIQFSTTRFFTDQFLRSYRMSRLKELLLLAFRMALCALFAVALASPILLPKGGSPLAGQSRSVVLVIDNSASMGLEDDGRTLLERAQTAAAEVLDSLRPGDTAAVVLAARRAAGPDVLFPEPTPELGDVKQRVGGLQVAALGTDLAAAVAKAEQVVAKSSAESKEIYVFSDLQDSGWEVGDETATPDDSEAMVFFVRTRAGEPRDLAVTALQYAAARPMVGVPFAIRPHIRNQGRNVGSTVVRLAIDGDVVAERKLDALAGGRWTVPRFHHTFARGGWHKGYVEIDDDSLAADNRRYFAFDVVDSASVLAVNGAPSRIGRLDELFFLKTALGATSQAKSPIRLDVVAPDAVVAAELGRYRAVVLANVESLPAAAVERLETYVDRGGSLLVFLGDRTNQPFFNSALAAPTRLHGGLSPGKLLGVEGTPSAKEQKPDTAVVGAVDFDHPALSAFNDPRFAGLSGVSLRALWTVEPTGSAVLMRANTGSPLLLEKPFGKGRVMLFTSTCDRDWNNFPVRPAYLPWIYRLVGYLAQEPAAGEGFLHTGDVLAVPLSASEGLTQVLVRTPAGTVKTASAGDDADAPLAFADTDEPGVYHLYAPGHEDNAQRFVANLESYESDLTYLDEVFAERDTAADSSTAERIEAGFRELLGSSPWVTYVAAPEKLNEASQAARRGLKLWDLVLLAALAVALAEPWLANRISLRHYGKPKEVLLPPKPQEPALLGGGK